ncbi:MAG: FecR domain-containing protein [Bacteroidetes bacterium]|nr:FecR domain-containing protein [Bacteroidota bacterium]
MDQLQSLIKKFWAGTANEEEKKQLLRLLDSSEEELRLQMRHRYDQDLQQDTKVIVPIWRRASVRWAAAAAILVAIALPALLRQKPRGSRIAVARSLPAADTISNRGVKEMVLTMSDGTVVTLYPGSMISYPAPFNGERREVRMEGKASFAVARDMRRPFSVLAPGLTTTVLGTRFLVNSGRSGDSWVQLFDGSVRVRYAPEHSAAREILLRPGEQVLVRPGAADLVLSPIPESSTTARLTKKEARKKISGPDDRIEFRQERLAIIFKQLEVRYRTRIVFDPAEVKGLVFTGSFSPDKDLLSIVRLITAMNDLKAGFRGDSLIITK